MFIWWCCVPSSSAVAKSFWNGAMSSVRVSAEWIFKDIINYFKFLDFKKNLKVQLSVVGKMYIACTLLQNATCCLSGWTTSKYFEVQPPTPQEYLFVNRWHSCIIATSSVDKLQCFTYDLLYCTSIKSSWLLSLNLFIWCLKSGNKWVGYPPV